MDLLTVDVRDQDGWRVLVARGQLDVATAPQFRQALVEAQYGGESRVVVDLDEVEFIDSMGLGVLVGGVKRARSHRGRFVVVCSHPRVLRLLEVTGLDAVLDVVADQAAVPPA
jgi:anti-sigma B factor antagonist